MNVDANGSNKEAQGRNRVPNPGDHLISRKRPLKAIVAWMDKLGVQCFIRAIDTWRAIRCQRMGRRRHLTWRRQRPGHYRSDQRLIEPVVIEPIVAFSEM